jgi:ectoine hydroxylase-related dioxygenase (phytanoyl-CoA dioxygenase family)
MSTGIREADNVEGGRTTSRFSLSLLDDESCDVDTFIQQFHEDGFIIIEDCFPLETIDKAHTMALNNFNECINHIEHNNLHFGIGIKHGFKEIVQRHPSRFEMPYKMDSEDFNFVLINHKLMKIVERILETKEYIIANRSCVNSKPGTEYQGWHTDGPHVSVTEYLKCHVFNMFIPLVDVTSDKGPTEFRPGSQRFTNNLAKGMLLAKIKKQIRPIEAPTLKRGSVLLVIFKVIFNFNTYSFFNKFDYRVLHRGGANISSEHRPVLVFTFAKPWYRVGSTF